MIRFDNLKQLQYISEINFPNKIRILSLFKSVPRETKKKSGEKASLYFGYWVVCFVYERRSSRGSPGTVISSDIFVASLNKNTTIAFPLPVYPEHCVVTLFCV